MVHGLCHPLESVSPFLMNAPGGLDSLHQVILSPAASQPFSISFPQDGHFCIADNSKTPFLCDLVLKTHQHFLPAAPLLLLDRIYCGVDSRLRRSERPITGKQAQIDEYVQTMAARNSITPM